MSALPKPATPEVMQRWADEAAAKRAESAALVLWSHRLAYRAGIPREAAKMIDERFAALEARILALEKV